jgi:predicted nucleic acid-binding protein
MRQMLAAQPAPDTPVSGDRERTHTKTAHDEIAEEDLASVWAELDALPIQYDPLTDVAAVIALALDLERRSAFDAAYVALASRIGAELGPSTDRSLATPAPAAMP